MEFSHHLQREWNSEKSGEKSILYGKPYKIHFLAYFTLQDALIMINIFCKDEDHENHVRRLDLTTDILATLVHN